MNEEEKLHLYNYLSITLSDNSEEKYNLQELLAGTLNDEIKERAFKAFLSKTPESIQNFEVYRALLKYKKDIVFSMAEDERRQFEDEILRYLEKNKLIQKTDTRKELRAKTKDYLEKSFNEVLKHVLVDLLAFQETEEYRIICINSNSAKLTEEVNGFIPNLSFQRGAKKDKKRNGSKSCPPSTTSSPRIGPHNPKNNTNAPNPALTNSNSLLVPVSSSEGNVPSSPRILSDTRQWMKDKIENTASHLSTSGGQRFFRRAMFLSRDRKSNETLDIAEAASDRVLVSLEEKTRQRSKSEHSSSLQRRDTYRSYELRKEKDNQYAHLIDKFDLPPSGTVFEIASYFLCSAQSAKEIKWFTLAYRHFFGFEPFIEEICNAYRNLVQKLEIDSPAEELASQLATLGGRAANFMKIFVPLEVMYWKSVGQVTLFRNAVQKFIDVIKQSQENENIAKFVTMLLANSTSTSSPHKARQSLRWRISSATPDGISQSPPSGTSLTSSPSTTQPSSINASSSSIAIPTHSHGRVRQLTDWGAKKVARHLCIIDVENMAKIGPSDFYSAKWTSQNVESITNSCKFTNNLVFWFLKNILQYDTPKERSYFLKHVVEIAEELLQSLNFNSLLATTLFFQQISELNSTCELLSHNTAMTMQYVISVMNPVNNFKSYRLLIDANNPRFIACLEVLLKDLLYEFEKHDNVMSPTRSLIAHVQKRSSSSYLRAGLTGGDQFGEFKSSVTINLAPTVIVDSASTSPAPSPHSLTNSAALSPNNELSGSPPDSPTSGGGSPLSRSGHVPRERERERDDAGDSSSASEIENDDTAPFSPTNSVPHSSLLSNQQQLSAQQKKKLFLVKNEKKHFRRSKILKDINTIQNERERHQHVDAKNPPSPQSSSPPQERETNSPPNALSETNTTERTEGGAGLDDKDSPFAPKNKISSSKEKLLAAGGSSTGGTFIKLSLSPRTSPRDQDLTAEPKTPDRSLRKSVEISNTAVLINPSPSRIGSSDEKDYASAPLSLSASKDATPHSTNANSRHPSPSSTRPSSGRVDPVVVPVGYDANVVYNCGKLMQIGQLISLAAKCQEYPEQDEDLDLWLDPTLLAFLLSIADDNYDAEGIERLMRRLMEVEKPEKEGKEKAKDRERDRERDREVTEKPDKDQKEVVRDRRSK